MMNRIGRIRFGRGAVFDGEGLEVGDELFVFFADEFPFEVVTAHRAGFAGGIEEMVGEDALEVWKNLEGRGVCIWDVNAEEVAARFEVGNLAGGIEGGEFLHGFWKWDFESLDGIHGCSFACGNGARSSVNSEPRGLALG